MVLIFTASFLSGVLSARPVTAVDASTQSILDMYREANLRLAWEQAPKATQELAKKKTQFDLNGFFAKCNPLNLALSFVSGVLIDTLVPGQTTTAGNALSHMPSCRLD